MLFRIISRCIHKKPSSKLVNIQIPPSVIPFESYDDQPRNKPSRTGYFDPKDPAYVGWSESDDKKLIDLMNNSNEGKLNDYAKVAQKFTGKTARDIRMRWNTFLRPKNFQYEKPHKEALWMKGQAQGNVEIVDGRWCYVPKASVTYLKQAKPLQHKERDRMSVSHGVSSLAILSQSLHDIESSKPKSDKLEAHWMRQEGVLKMDQIKWSVSEDLVLLEAFETFGPQWNRISQSLKAKKRLPSECRERMEQLCRE